MTIGTSGGTGLVDKDGVGLPATRTITVNPETTSTVDLYYDLAGKITPITFKTAPYSGSTPIVQKNERAVLFNPEMESSKVIGSSSTRVESLSSPSLFPFGSTYAVYAGGCTVNNPSAVTPKFEAGVTNVTVPANGTVAAAVTLPALQLSARIGNVATNWTSTNGLTVKVTDNNGTCPNPVRTFKPETVPAAPATGGVAGRLAEPGFPYGNYTVCVSGKVGTTFEKEVQTFDLKEAAVSKIFNLTSGDTNGTC